MTYEKDKKQYIGPWEKNLKHGIGVELNLKGNTKRMGEWRKGKWIRWLSNTQRIDDLMRDRMLNSSNMADVTHMGIKLESDVVHENDEILFNKQVMQELMPEQAAVCYDGSPDFEA